MAIGWKTSCTQWGRVQRGGGEGQSSVQRPRMQEDGEPDVWSEDLPGAKKTTIVIKWEKNQKSTTIKQNIARRLVRGSSKRKESPPSKGNTMLCNLFGSHATWRAQMSIKSVSGLKRVHHLLFCNYIKGNHAIELCRIVRSTMIVSKCWISPELCSDKSSNFQKVTQSIDEREESF